jgi:hypothetical protein
VLTTTLTLAQMARKRGIEERAKERISSSSQGILGRLWAAALVARLPLVDLNWLQTPLVSDADLGVVFPRGAELNKESLSIAVIIG